MKLNIIPGLVLATRSDAHNDTLSAFIAHHLQVCEKAVVLIDHRPGQATNEAEAVCAAFGDRVTVAFHESDQFNNGQACTALEAAVSQTDAVVVMHLDKDEFCSNLELVEGIFNNIVARRSDYAEGRMVCRFAPGGHLHDASHGSFEEYCLAAPVRSQVLSQYGSPDLKCYMNRAPYIRIHRGDPGWRKDKQGMVLEHFRWTFDCKEKTDVKILHHRSSIRSAQRHRDRNVINRTGDFMKKLDKGFRPYAWTIPGWMDYGDLYRKIARALPDDGVFCEVGVFKGRSLCYMGEYLALLAKPAHVIGYDWFDPDWKAYSGPQVMRNHSSDGWLEIVSSNLRRACPWNTPDVRRSDSADAANFHEDASVDAVWIDAGHDFDSVVRDVTAWLPKIKPGGILAGHDIQMAPVARALNHLGVKWRRTSKSSWIACGDEFLSL